VSPETQQVAEPRTARRSIDSESAVVPGGLSVPSLQEDHAPPSGTLDWELLRRMRPYLRPHRVLLFVAFAAMPAVAGANLVQPLLLKRAIDAVVVEGGRSALMTVVALYAAATLAETVFRFVQTYTMQLAGQRSMADLRRAVFEHIQRLPVRYFDRNPVGRLMTRVTTDVDALNELFTSGVVTVFGDLFTLLGIMGVMLALDWRLALVTFAVIPFFFLVTNWFRRGARSSFREVRKRVRAAWLNASAARRRVDAATLSVESAGTSYKAMRKARKLGSATSTAVLEALHNQTRARRDYWEAVYEYLVSWLRLKYEAGALDAEAMKTVDALLVP